MPLIGFCETSVLTDGVLASVGANDGPLLGYCIGCFEGLRVLFGLRVGVRRFLLGAGVTSGPSVSDAVGTAATTDL